MKVIKNQGQCGSCWAFSTIGSIESREEIKSGKYTSLSEQQLVDCVAGSTCDGGVYQNAFNYSRDNGNDAESAYPYTAMNGSCQARSHTPVGKFVHSQTPARGVNNLKNAIAAGPVSVAIEADQAKFQQ